MKVVEKRTTADDMEVNLITGKNNQDGLLLTLDRATQKTTIDKIGSEKPQHINGLILKTMKGNPHLKIMTLMTSLSVMHQDVVKQKPI